MNRLNKKILMTSVAAILCVGGSATALRIQTKGTPHPLVKEMVDTIKSRGQDATCVQSGIFRRAIVRPGSPIPVPGGNCQSADFARMAFVLCDGYKIQMVNHLNSLLVEKLEPACSVIQGWTKL